MGVGHLAVGLMLKRIDPAINLGMLFFLVFLSDFLLGVFYHLGLESAVVPEGFSDRHYLVFNFPFSHGLIASIFWSGLVFLIVLAMWRLRAAIIAAIAVFSHFILDGMVHVPGVPLAGADSAKIGLRLWSNMTLALTIEMILVVAGLILYFDVANRSFRGRWGVVIFMLVFAVLTIFGMTASEAPELNQLGIGWLAIPPVTGLIAWWLDRKGAAKS